MYRITLEWKDGSTTQTQEFDLTCAVSLGIHSCNRLIIKDKSVKYQQAIIFADKENVYLKCLHKAQHIYMNSGPTLYQGDVGHLYPGTCFYCGTTCIRVASLTHPVARASRYFPLATQTSAYYAYTAV